MEIRAEEITRIIREQLGGFAPGTSVSEEGEVLSVGDGIARIHGLARCMAGELLELPHGVMGIALNLEEDSVGAVLMGETSAIKQGDKVKRSKRIMSIPVGEAMIGRVVNALGQPIDGKGEIKTSEFSEIEKIAPGRGRTPAGARAARDRHQADRQHGQHRPRPARAVDR